MIVGQLLLSFLVVWLTTGVLGRYGQTVGLPLLAVVVVWLAAWLGSLQFSLRQALMIGLLLDLLGYAFFGFWTALLLLLVAFTIWTRQRFFSVSSWVETALSLLLVASGTEVIFGIYAKTFTLKIAIASIIGTVIVGMISYYIVAARLRLFGQWRGTRVQ